MRRDCVFVVVATLALLYLYSSSVEGAWPPNPPPTPPQIGRDIPGSDIGGMPITLSSPDYNLCSSMCDNTPNCRAWAYGIPNCGDHTGPLCWLKFHANLPSVSNPCRVFGTNTKPCQLETQWTNQVDPNNPLPDYPRPQLVRPPSTWKNLNGLWQFEFASVNQTPPFGNQLNGSVLVPFPIESCLSGVQRTGMYLFYRLLTPFPFPSSPQGSRVILHFGAVDWQTTVYVNTKQVYQHTGGYSGFSVDVTNVLNRNQNNEIFLYIYDPSNYGSQPYGKQRIGAIENPGGDTYTPSSGVWQTVWMENVPNSYIERIKITPDLQGITINVTSLPGSGLPVQFAILDGNTIVAQQSGLTGQPVRINVPSPKLWDSESPFLYDLNITLFSGSNAIDNVNSYFGLRTISIGKDSQGITRPLLNGNFTFLAGWLDQSWWPDGEYTAPTDDALLFDLKAVKKFGLNFVRLHQKVNPERWYWYADQLGIVVQQDAVQHYGDQHGVIPSQEYYMHDLKAMIDDRYNHPCIVQWTAFNEDDMVTHFNPPEVVAWIEKYDPSRMVDTDSGGPANNLYIGDVNDVHTYPVPGDPKPSATQYAEVGEYGGLGWFQSGHMWAQNLCGSYKTVNSSSALADLIIQYAELILSNKKDISICVYTQITDVENECDGYYNFDRTNKFSSADSARLYQANQNMINSPVPL